MAKLVKDAAFGPSPALASTNVGEALTALASLQPDLFADGNVPLYTNIDAVVTTQVEGEDVEHEIYEIGQNEEGEIVFDFTEVGRNHIKDANLVLVAIHSDDETIETESGPIDAVERLFLLELPSNKVLLSNPKLAQYRDELLRAQTLKAGRSLARKIHKGETSEAVTDPITAFITAMTRRDSAEKAFDRMHSWVQLVLLTKAQQHAARLKENGQHANARAVLTTFSRGRLSRINVRACLVSQESAASFFPALVNKDPNKGPEGLAWDNLLDQLIKQAPKHKIKRSRKDENGKTIKGEDGKVVYDFIDSPQDPTWFLRVKDTRYDTEGSVTDDLDLSSIMFGDTPAA